MNILVDGGIGIGSVWGSGSGFQAWAQCHQPILTIAPIMIVTLLQIIAIILETVLTIIIKAIYIYIYRVRLEVSD